MALQFAQVVMIVWVGLANSDGQSPAPGDGAARPVAFVGTVDFEYRGPKGEGYGGRVYYGAAGERRLDIFMPIRIDSSGGGEARQETMVCSVAGAEAWLFFSLMPTTRLASLPIGNDAPGWLGQLRAKVGQTRAWAAMLRPAVDSSGAALRDFAREVHQEQISRSPSGRIERVDFGPGAVEYRGIQGTDGKWAPTEVYWITPDRRDAWQIISVSEKAANDKEFAACFQVDAARELGSDSIERWVAGESVITPVIKGSAR